MPRTKIGLCLCALVLGSLGLGPGARTTACAEDGPATPAPFLDDEPPHPLLQRWSAQIARREHQVAALMEALVRLANLYVASGARDADADGKGEYAPLADLLAQGGTPGRRYDPPAWAANVELDAQGIAHVDGYLLRVDLPESGDLAATTDLREDRFVLIAWPERYGATGRATLRTDDKGDLRAADLSRNSGVEHAPHPTSFVAVEEGDTDGPSSPDPFVSPIELPRVPVPETQVADGPWRDAAKVRRAFDAALADVERLCGAQFGEERPTVAIVTRKETFEVLRGEAERGLLGEVPTERRAAYLETLAEAMYGKYDEARDRVLVTPSNAEAFAHVAGWPELIGEDALRSVLTHELTHALDVRRFPLTQLRTRTRDPEARRALAAVIEGHAEMVAALAANERGDAARAAHELVTRSITEAPGIAGPQDVAALRPLAAAFAFPYRQGREFCEAIVAAGGASGGASALERALREPPQRVRQIEAPKRWLDPVPDPRPTLDAALAPLSRLAPAGAAPSHESMLATTLRAAYAEIDATRLDAALARFEAGRTLGAVADRGARIFSAAILTFEDDASAAEFAALLRDSAALSQGAAPAREGVTVTLDDVDQKSGALPGFVLRQSTADGKRDARIRIAHSGRHVLEVTLLGMQEVAAVQLEAALNEAAALVTTPAATPPK